MQPRRYTYTNAVEPTDAFVEAAESTNLVEAETWQAATQLMRQRGTADALPRRQTASRTSAPPPTRQHATTSSAPSTPKKPLPRHTAARTTEEHRATAPTPAPSLSRRRLLASGPLAAGMLSAGILLAGGKVAVTAIEQNQEHYHYGDALVYRLDAPVGHGNGISHFLSVTVSGHILVIEVVDEPLQTSLYRLPLQYHTGDTAPHLVTLKVVHVNPHGRPGFPDLLVQPAHSDDGGPHVSSVLYNNGKTFQAEPPTS